MNDRFYFAGFLPAKAKQRESALARLTNVSATLVFYEAPHRIIETADALLAAFGPERQIVFARELTKLFEDIHRCRLSEAPAWLAADQRRQKGEFVILIEGADSERDESQAEADRVLAILMAECPL